VRNVWRGVLLVVLTGLTLTALVAGRASAVPPAFSDLGATRAATAAATAEPGDATSTTAEPVEDGDGVAQPADGAAPVVLLGVPGLLWTDLDPDATPALWELAGRASTASMSVRTVSAITCPVDGWLIVGAGRRAEAVAAADEVAQDSTEQAEDAPLCTDPLAPVAADDGSAVAAWDTLVAHNASLRYDAQLGALGDSLASAGVQAQAVGRGAAYALARSDGRVSSYLPEGTAITRDLLESAPLTVVDLGSVKEPSFASAGQPLPPREEQLAALDDRLEAVLGELPAGATLLVAALAGTMATPHLTVAMADGPAVVGSFGDSWLDARSTRRTALVQLTDVASTLLGLLGVDQAPAFSGSTWQPGGARPATTGQTVDVLVDLDTAARTVDSLRASFFALLLISQFILYGAAALALKRDWGGRPRRLRVLRTTRRTALGFAAVPVATYLSNTLPWWRTGAPVLALVAAVLGWVVCVTLAAQLGPWRRHFLGPFGVIAGVTGLVLAADVLTGSRLQLSSLMGYSPLVAGRFYGFGNLAFALFSTGMLLATAAAVEPLVRGGYHRVAIAVVAIVGVVTAILDGWTAWGSDFGGVIAIVPGFAVFALLVTGRRVSVLRFGAIMAAAMTAISVIATLDWLRPPAERAHLGRFVQQVLSGDALIVIQRKLEANLSILTSNVLITLLVPAAMAFVVVVLMRPVEWRAAALDLAYAASPTLRPALAATVVMLVVAFAVNDSGIAIPAVALTMAVPLTLAASVRALEREELSRVDPPPTRAPTPLRS
jgi:hypothetical protein